MIFRHRGVAATKFDSSRPFGSKMASSVGSRRRNSLLASIKTHLCHRGLSHLTSSAGHAGVPMLSAPERLATRHRRARDNRIRQRPDRQFRPRRAEAHAARVLPVSTGAPKVLIFDNEVEPANPFRFAPLALNPG
jgi:hypothetical protein